YLPLAVQMLVNRDFNPHYFENPPLLTYIQSAVVAVVYGTRRILGLPPMASMHFWWLLMRSMTVAFGIGICVGVYLLAREWLDARAAIFAAFICAVSFLLVRDSHYAVNDIPATFFALSAVCILVGNRKQRPAMDVISGGVAGAAVAVKYNLGVVVVPLIVI